MIDVAENQGGCLCGELRYAFLEPVADTGYCHCRMCRVSLGAPVSAWLSVPSARFRWTRGTPRIYRSSQSAERHFCSSCGSQILFIDHRTEPMVDVNVGTTDFPDRFPPDYHIWTGSQVSWLSIEDDLPRYTDDGPDRPPTIGRY